MDGGALEIKMEIYQCVIFKAVINYCLHFLWLFESPHTYTDVYIYIYILYAFEFLTRSHRNIWNIVSELHKFLIM